MTHVYHLSFVLVTSIMNVFVFNIIATTAINAIVVVVHDVVYDFTFTIYAFIYFLTSCLRFSLLVNVKKVAVAKFASMVR